MSRKSDREYLLTIQGTKLGGEYLSLPQYPPQEFEGLTYVAAQLTKSGNTEVTLGVERGIKLNAFLKDYGIWVKIAQ